MTRLSLVALLGTFILVGCNRIDQETTSLADARKGFKTKLSAVRAQKLSLPTPPANVLEIVQYDTPVGKLPAYLSPDPKDGKKHPAIVWINGGDCNSIDDGCWKRQPASNDQSASQYREAGIVMMFPTLRGGNENPSTKEGFFGEVDDVLAAADYLAKQPYVDPARIYLGGHSTGGTLVLLVAECSDRFRATFSFGPVEDVSGYEAQYTPFNTKDRKEVELRSPGRWLSSIKSPVFVLEGTSQGNISSLKAMARATNNPNAHFLPVKGATHFSVLAPVNRLLAQKIVADTGPACNITVTEDEVNKAVK
jgi:pimeloyl-ACP methyl ester carboxylesterase